jgi:UDP-GlcNAc:undecaprenyl-phosphate GlcNAc-1-phosphate transferase
MFEAFAAALVLSVCLIRALIPMAVPLGLVDAPCLRKRHKGVVPLIGGLAIYIALVPLALLFPFWQAHHGMWLLALGFPLLLIGLADDRWEISARKRLVVEVCCGLLAIVYGGVQLHDIGSLLPNVGGTLVLLSIPLTIVGMVGVINAVNMTDGVDGLAGGLATLTFGALAYLTYPTDVAVAQQLITFVAVLLGFLFFNSRFFGRKRAAIFLGDGGSIFIGFALAWYLISLSQGDSAVIKPVDALWLLAVPLIDTMTIMTRRIRHGRSPFSADREHLHHILMLSGFGANGTVLIILASHAFFILIGIASIHYQLTEWIAFVMFVALFLTYYAAMTHAWKVMKRVKHFREWAGFEDRRKEDRRTAGRSSGSDRRFARDQELAETFALRTDTPGH